MSSTWGEIAREEIQKRGLLFFSDVVDDVRSLPQAEIRAVLAVAAAHRLARMRVGDGEADELDRQCAAAIHEMWLLLIAGTPSTSGEWPWLLRLREAIHGDGDDEDRDVVAATLFAAQALADGNADAAAWAVSRLIDGCFASVDEEARMSTGQVDDFIRECAAPEVQAVLSRLDSAAQALLKSGLSAGTVAKVREAFDAG
jgi:hypothetical protein